MINKLLIGLFIVALIPRQHIRFTAETIDEQFHAGNDLAIGDVDGDGKPDILLASKHRVVWYRNGDWQQFVLVENRNYNYIRVAARDIDGDGRAEVAVGAHPINPQSTDSTNTFTLQYLIQPEIPTQPWMASTVDRGYPIQQLQWINVGEKAHQLLVLPTSLYQNSGSQSEHLRAYERPTDPDGTWKRRLIVQPMPQASHFSIYTFDNQEVCYINGDGGIMGFRFKDGRWTRNSADWLARGRQLLKAKIGSVDSRNTHVFAAFEPLSADLLTIYSPQLGDSLLLYNTIGRRIIERTMNDGQGLAMADFLGLDRDQVVAGWREPNSNGDFGIKLYVPFNQYWEAVDVYWIDRGGMACDGLVVADMDSDGKPDIIAFGSTTHNLKIYWNQNK